MSITATVPGRLGQDPELKELSNGNAVLNLSVATEAREKVDGQWEKKTTWVRCAVWGKQAEALAKFLTKGMAVTVVGQLSTREYERRDGGTGFALECNCYDITVQGGGAPRGEGGPAESYDQSAPGKAPSSDDIPF